MSYLPIKRKDNDTKRSGRYGMLSLDLTWLTNVHRSITAIIAVVTAGYQFTFALDNEAIEDISFRMVSFNVYIHRETLE